MLQFPPSGTNQTESSWLPSPRGKRGLGISARKIDPKIGETDDETT